MILVYASNQVNEIIELIPIAEESAKCLIDIGSYYDITSNRFYNLKFLFLFQNAFIFKVSCYGCKSNMSDCCLMQYEQFCYITENKLHYDKMMSVLY